MTASEFAFMTLGLVLGGAIGAALLFVIGARPPAPREIRLTVASDAVPRRVPATLSVDAFARTAAEPARGGPADRRMIDRPIPVQAVPVQAVPGRAGSVLTISARAIADAEAVLADRQPAVADRRAAVAVSGPRVGIPIQYEPDLTLQEIRATQAVPATVSTATAVLEREPVNAMGPGSAWDVKRTIFEERDMDGSVGSAAPSGPCADAARHVEDRCRQAEVARLGADTSSRALGEVRREYDDQRNRVEHARAAIEPRRMHDLKEEARATFRGQRRAASTRGGLDDAARTWLTTIDRLNGTTREATLAMMRAETAVASLLPGLEQLVAQADAATLSAESAAAGCLEARATLADCREAAASGRSTGPASLPSARPNDLVAGPADAPDRMTVSHGTAVVVRIVQGDREARSRVAATLSRDIPAASRPWADLLAEFADGVRARAIEEALVEVGSDHPFWTPFTQQESRDIVAALSALGFRFDGLGGWTDDRAPTQRELSMAVGYAGQDPMRVRHWPSETEMADLLRDATVAADEYLERAGGELTLTEAVDLLGARADGLTGLWDAWGTIRPLLLALAEEDAPSA